MSFWDMWDLSQCITSSVARFLVLSFLFIYFCICTHTHVVELCWASKTNWNIGNDYGNSRFFSLFSLFFKFIYRLCCHIIWCIIKQDLNDKQRKKRTLDVEHAFEFSRQWWNEDKENLFQHWKSIQIVRDNCECCIQLKLVLLALCRMRMLNCLTNKCKHILHSKHSKQISFVFDLLSHFSEEEKKIITYLRSLRCDLKLNSIIKFHVIHRPSLRALNWVKVRAWHNLLWYICSVLFFDIFVNFYFIIASRFPLNPTEKKLKKNQFINIISHLFFFSSTLFRCRLAWTTNIYRYIDR